MCIFRPARTTVSCALEDSMRRPEALQRWYLSINEINQDSGQVFAQSIEGLGWAELDFPADLRAAVAGTGQPWVYASKGRQLPSRRE